MEAMAHKPKRNQLADDLLLVTLMKFYTEHPNDYDRLFEIVQLRSKGSPSLRTVEFGVANKAHSQNTWFLQTIDGEVQWVNMYDWYKDCLGDYRKVHFDPFRRTDKIQFCIPGRDNAIETTIAQLVFSRKLFSSGIMDMLCIKENRNAMERTMARCLAEQRKRVTRNNNAPKYKRCIHSIKPAHDVKLIWGGTRMCKKKYPTWPN